MTDLPENRRDPDVEFEIASSGEGSERDAAIRMAIQLGAAQGLALAGRSTKVYELLMLQQIKEHRAYRGLGYTWETFCREALGRARSSVDEDLNNLHAFGRRFMDVAERLSLGRDVMRELRRIPEDARPRVLESGELEVGEERVSLDDRDQVQDLLERIVSGQEELREQISKGEEQLERKDSQLDELRDELKRLQSGTARISEPWMDAMLEVLKWIARSEDLLEDAQPEKEVVHKFWSRISRAVSEKLLPYATDYRPTYGEDDPDPLENSRTISEEEYQAMTKEEREAWRESVRAAREADDG